MTHERWEVRALYEERMQAQRLRREVGMEMFIIRCEAKVTLTALARELGVVVPHLIDMELGHRTYQDKYVDIAIIYCSKAMKRQKKLIKNQNIKQ